MGNTLSMLPPEEPRDQEAELAMRIKEEFSVVAVGDLLQMAPIACRRDEDIQALVEQMRGADMTFANNECTVMDRRTFRGKPAHQNTLPAVADDWVSMGIQMVTKANNHTHASGDEGLQQNWEQLHRVGIEYVGADYNLDEARLARFRTTPKGIVGLVGAYAEVKDYSQWSGLPAGEVVTVLPQQLAQLQAMRDSILARRSEVPVAVADPEPDIPGSVLVFGRVFATADAVAAVRASLATMKRRIKEYKDAKGTVTTAVNTLDLVVSHGVTASQMAQLRAIAGVEESTEPSLHAFGVRFKVMPLPGEYSYEMDAQNLQDILREVRTGKQFSDFLAATIHWHQNRYAFQHYSFDHYPADYQIQYAHLCIDHGADLFFAHGVHTVKGVEIYKGKPVFYGLSNYIFHNQMFRSWRDHGPREPAALTAPVMGDGEYNERRWQWLQRPQNMQALLVKTRFVDRKLVDVLLYPADLGLTPRPGSEVGTPRRPAPDVARKILEDVIEFSKPFGTEIVIRNGVGVVQLP